MVLASGGLSSLGRLHKGSALSVSNIVVKVWAGLLAIGYMLWLCPLPPDPWLELHRCRCPWHGQCGSLLRSSSPGSCSCSKHPFQYLAGKQEDKEAELWFFMCMMILMRHCSTNYPHFPFQDLYIVDLHGVAGRTGTFF